MTSKLVRVIVEEGCAGEGVCVADTVVESPPEKVGADCPLSLGGHVRGETG